jgi:hypothetical protein
MQERRTCISSFRQNPNSCKHGSSITPWLKLKTSSQPPTTSSGAWKSHVNFSGFVYFAYTFQTNIVLPINWLKTTGKREGKSIKLNWTINNTTDLDGFELERSVDGKTWESIATLSKNERQYIDNEGITRAIYYRINAKILRAPLETSPVISIESTTSNSVLTAFPNPFSNTINLPDLPIEKVELINNQGQIQQISVDNNQIKGLHDLPEGLYILRVLMGGNWSQTKMVKE